MSPVRAVVQVIKGRVGNPAFWALAAASVFVVSLAYQIKTPFAVDVGDPSSGEYLSGFHDIESSDALSYRWSSNSSSVVFPGIGAYAPAVITLGLNGSRPGQLPPPTVTVRANDQEIGSFPVTGDFETYHLAIDRAVVGISGALRVELISDTFVPHESTGSGDLRELGVLVGLIAVRFVGGPTTIVLPALWPVVCFVSGILLTYLLACQFVSWRWAWAVSLGFLALLLVALTIRRLLTARYCFWALAMPGLGLLAMEGTRRIPRTRKAAVWYAVGVLSILLGLYRLGSVVRLSWLGVAPDLANNYAAAAILRSGGTLYDASAPLLTGYDNPPFTAIITMPLTLLDLQTAIRFFLGLNTALLALSLAVIYVTKREYLLTFPYSLVAIGLVLNLDPVLDSLLLGQLDFVILSLIVVCFWAWRQGHDAVAGASLGLATMIKLSPALLILYFILKKQVRVVASAVAALLILGLASLLFAGLDAHVTFVARVLPTLLAGSAQVENQSLNAFFNRIFLDGDFLTGLGDTPPIPQVRLLTLAFCLAIVGVAILLVDRRLTSRTDLRTELEFSLVVVTLPLVSSIAWHHYMTWYVLPFLILLDPRLRRNLSEHTFRACTALVSASYLALVVPISAYAPRFLEGPGKLVVSIRLYAGLALFGVFAYLISRQRVESPSETTNLEVLSEPESAATGQLGEVRVTG